MKHFLRKLAKNKTWIVFLLLALVFFPKAFYREAESDTRAIITAVGIDKKDDEYEISGLMVVPSNTSDPSSNLYLVSTKGKTVGEAFNQMSHNIGKGIGLAHCDFIVVNDEVLEDDITKTIDYFVRQYNITKRAYIINCASGAKKMLETALNTKSLSTVLLTNLVQKDNKSTMGAGSNIDAIYRMYFGKSGITYLNVYDIETPEDDKSQGGGQESSGESGNSSEQSGQSGGSDSGGGSQNKEKEKIKGTEKLLFLKKGKKVCEIDKEETLFYEIYKKALRSTFMLLENISDSDKSNANVGLNIIQIINKNSFYFDDGKPTIKCEMTLIVALYEICDTKTSVEQMDNAKTHIGENIKDAIKEKIKKGADGVMEKSRQNNIDIMEFVDVFSKRKTKQWEKYMSTHSEEDYLQDCQIVLDIKIKDKF